MYAYITKGVWVREKVKEVCFIFSLCSHSLTESHISVDSIQTTVKATWILEVRSSLTHSFLSDELMTSYLIG